MNPRGEHARAVGDQQIAGPQQVRQVAHGVMGHGVGPPIKDQQPSGVARLDGSLRDQLRRQGVVEVGKMHGEQALIYLAR